jgi:hypothetical protein
MLKLSASPLSHHCIDVNINARLPRLSSIDSDKFFNRLRVRFRSMGIFKSLRSKSKLESHDGFDFYDEKLSIAVPTGPNHFARLQQRDPQAYDTILNRIMEFVCPHVLDTTYCSLDEVDLGDTCMLCNMRDLAHCAQVCTSWSAPATKLL